MVGWARQSGAGLFHSALQSRVPPLALLHRTSSARNPPHPLLPLAPTPQLPLEQPSPAEALSVLRGLRGRYEVGLEGAESCDRQDEAEGAAGSKGAGAVGRQGYVRAAPGALATCPGAAASPSRRWALAAVSEVAALSPRPSSPKRHHDLLPACHEAPSSS
jgi:hypothetical protein